MSAVHKSRAQVDMVLDDAVVNDSNSPKAIEMRMGVSGLDAAVGGPARVADALRCAGIRASAAVDTPDVFVDQQVFGSGKRQSPRVVPSVLECFQRSDNRLADVALLPNVAKNAAHACPSLAGTPAKRIQ